MRMIFVNLPVKNIEASRRFFGALGFSFNPDFSGEDSACMIIADNIFAMLLSEARFKDFITGEIGDTTKGKEVLICLSAESRAEVDDLLAKALAHGGKPWLPTNDLGAMYGASFQDPDGHVWELAYMDMDAFRAAQMS